MKQTAVDWLIEKLHRHSPHIDILDVASLNNYWNQAMQMEKQQIEDAFDEGLCEGFDYATIKDCIDSDTGKQYYTETYGKDG